ncbi:hypothetical protein PP639_gp045 [Arthrobacter phage Seahorse]|uniref:Uncharacterized protein n=1 Tax=Arthrobacter phage Seahorse TaxID=2419611 RepID=A0A3G3M518_9CAUD|nr:hypothetical protein PP639_gp045 [Arthrobacter phage Seahorse]AYR01545.1 hypothetical protein PBI_SEAHORSE_45 [Arthrobacter phage Seahorse]
MPDRLLRGCRDHDGGRIGAKMDVDAVNETSREWLEAAR